MELHHLILIFTTGLIDPIIGPNISALQSPAEISSSSSSLGSSSSSLRQTKRSLMHQMPQASARKVEARFDDNSVNNSLSVTNIGDTVALHCRIWMKQSTTVSWSVDRGSSTMDLLTLDNMTFAGDPRYSVVVQNPTNWALVIDNVQARDAGKYICTLETFPKQSLMVYLQVDGPVLEIVNASTGLVYSTGSYLSIECVYSNTSRAQVQTTTQHPLFPLDQRILLKHDVLNWKFNNRTFSLQNRKRVHAYWTGNSVVSILSIKSAITEDTGNYSCILPNTGEKVTASLHILKSEHSSELRPDTLLASDDSIKLCFNVFTALVSGLIINIIN